MYERRLESSLYRARAELLKQQEKRKAAEKAPATAAPTDEKTNLKKQSQSGSVLMGANSSMTNNYDDKPPAGRRTNKANQSRSDLPRHPSKAQKAESATALRASP
jgi:hypothetical protein